MKGFHYRLEGVLGFEKTRERELQREAAERRAAAEQEARALEALHAEAADIQRRLEGAAANPGLAMAMLAALDGVAGRIAPQRQRLETAREAWTRKQEELVEAMRDRTKLERHRETCEEAHRAAAEAKQMEEADDLTTARFVHGKIREARR
jgi:flagellar export protein FliJ